MEKLHIKEQLYLNKKPYNGPAAFINGYNGYTETYDHGRLCAIINGSLWDDNKIPNSLKTKSGRLVRDGNRVGITYKYTFTR